MQLQHGDGICPRMKSAVSVEYSLTEHAQPANSQATTVRYLWENVAIHSIWYVLCPVLLELKG